MDTLPESLALTAPGQGAGLLALAAIFAIMFTVVLTTLRRAGVYSGGVNLVLAICASLLAVTGIMRTFSRGPSDPGGSEDRGWLDFILLPYTAWAIAMLLVLLLLLFWRSPIGRRLMRRWMERDSWEENPQSPGARDRRGQQNPE
jgi:small-conductance mechanosensitive channel